MTVLVAALLAALAAGPSAPGSENGPAPSQPEASERIRTPAGPRMMDIECPGPDCPGLFEHVIRDAGRLVPNLTGDSGITGFGHVDASAGGRAVDVLELLRIGTILTTISSMAFPGLSPLLQP